MALMQKGYHVLKAGNGVEALSLYEKHGGVVCAVLTDTWMPVMDGVTLTRELMTIDPSAKIIASTGSPDAFVQRELQNLGVKAFLLKPYTIGKLMEVLRAVLCAPELQMA